MEKKEKNNLRRLNSVLKKNSIIVIMIIFLFLACGYFYSYYMVVPKYKSTSTILLASNTLNKDSSTVTQTEVTLNKNLISTYGKILKSDNILRQVINNLNLDITKDELYKNIHIEEVKDTQILQIGVINESATEAQKIAQELNNVFIEEIKEIYKMDNINIVDNASYEVEPYNINHIRDIFIFLCAGIAFSSLIISIIFFFDTTIKIEQDIEEFSELNVIGTVPKHKNKGAEELIVQNNSKSVISEALKTIRTNISFTKLNNRARSILFTSCNSGEGKSWITSNIAVAYAQSNKNVIIVDADMRKGRQDKIFSVSNANGLSDCLKEINDNQDFETLEKYIKETKVPKVHLMTIGAVPLNPSELLLSSKMHDLINMLKCIYDIVIIDGTPCNLVSDSIPVSRIVDTTILVAESRKTKIEDLNNVSKLIKNAEGRIEGVILNKKAIKNKEYGKGYYYGETSENSKIEIEIHTVKELILNRKEYIDEEKEKKDSQIVLLNELAEKINGLEAKLLEIPERNLENYTDFVEDIKKIYKGEIDKNKLSEDIKGNIIKNELEKKIDEKEDETKKLLDEKLEKLDNTETLNDILEKIENAKEEQNKKIEELNSSEALNNILEKIEDIKENQNKKIEVIDNNGVLDIITAEVQELNKKYDKIKDIEKAIMENKEQERLNKMITGIKENERRIEKISSSEQFREIMAEIKKINAQYSKLSKQTVNSNIDSEEFEIEETNIDTEELEIDDKPLTSASFTRNNVIELNKVKDKMKQQELVVNCEEGVKYEQLLDLAVGVFELKPGHDDLKRRAE